MGSVSDKQQVSFHLGLESGRDTESGRVGEISNMYDILPIHSDKLENYNLS